MPKTSNTDLLKELSALKSTYPWIMLVEFDTDLGDYTYMCSNTEEVIWDSETWKPYPFVVGQVKSTSTGQLPKSSLAFFNTTEFNRAVPARVIGEDVTIYFLNLEHKGDFNRDTYPLQFSFKVLSVSINTAITLSLGAPNYLITKIPAKRYVRDYCNFTFNGEHCWVSDSLLTTLRSADSSLPTTCDKSYLLCKRYWDSGITNNVPNIPPYIGYGGFPTIDKGDINYD